MSGLTFDYSNSPIDQHILSPIGETGPLLGGYSVEGGHVDDSHDTERGAGLTRSINQNLRRLAFTTRLRELSNQVSSAIRTCSIQLVIGFGRLPPTLLYQVTFLVFWLILNLALIRQSWFSSTLIESNYFPLPNSPEWLKCVQSLWLKDDGCGLNGEDCSRFRSITLPFRCPSRCGTSTGLLNPRVIGGNVANYQPLVVGGGGEERRYRPDSFICQSAVHAGVISSRWGGCGILKMLDETDDFEPSEENGIRSIGFPAPFPASFIFLGGVQASGCHDLWILIIALNMLCTLFFTLILKPSANMFFWMLCVTGYWTVVVASEPSSLPPSLSKATGDFLPFLFVCYWLWKVSWSIVTETITSLEKIWVYLLPWWFGLHMNLALGWIPIDRLTPHDIRQRPGAILALSILVPAVALLISYQVWCLRKANRLVNLQLPYACLGSTLVLLLFVPQHSLRLHHYIIGIFLTPLTSVPSKLSGIFQGFLLGMIQNGIARWSFDSILEKTAQVIGDGYDSQDEMPQFELSNSGLINNFKDLKISWKLNDHNSTNKPLIGLMINDILRFVTSNNTLIIHNFLSNSTLAPEPNQFFFRASFFENKFNQNLRVGEFTGPVTFFVNNQTWVGPISVT